MMKEGASAPPRSISMTVNPILSTNCATKQTTTTNERKEGKKEERKDDTFLPAFDTSYTHLWYSSYIVNKTTVQEPASKLVMHHPTTTVSDCTVPDSTGSSDPTSTVTTLHTATFTTVIYPTMHTLNAPPTATKFTMLLTTSTVTDPIVTDSTAINSTVTLPTVLPLYGMTTTTNNVPTARANNSMTYMTINQYNAMKATLYPCKLVTLAMFFPHYSHPPYYA
jgi:hypothetical protein